MGNIPCFIRGNEVLNEGKFKHGLPENLDEAEHAANAAENNNSGAKKLKRFYCELLFILRRLNTYRTQIVECKKEKQIKKIEDTITIFKDLREKGKTLNIDSKYYYSYIANAVIYKISNLDNELYKKYKKVIKEEKIYELLMNDTFTKKIKNIILRISPKLYYKIKG